MDTEEKTGNSVRFDVTVFEPYRYVEQGVVRKDVVSRIIDSYLLHTPPLLQSLQEAIREGDARRAWESAHSLKSSSSMVGGKRLASYCLDMEKLGRQGSLTRQYMQSQLEKILQEFEYVKARLLEMKQGLPE